MRRLVLAIVVLAAGATAAAPTARIAATAHGGKLCALNDPDPRCHLTNVVASVQRFTGDRSARGVVELDIQSDLALWDCIDHATVAPVQAVTVDLVIDANGTVTSSVGKGRDPVMNRCIADTIAAHPFAKKRAHGAKPLWRHGKITANVIVMFSGS